MLPLLRGSTVMGRNVSIIYQSLDSIQILCSEVHEGRVLTSPCSITQYRFTEIFEYKTLSCWRWWLNYDNNNNSKKESTTFYNSCTIIISNHYFKLPKASIRFSTGKSRAASGWSDRQLKYLLVLWCIITKN